ncbi:MULTISPECIES: glutamyl-tRNA reductase [Uliginosibacterium]|uniref:Glutamyl-tRNA reductase n=1 Tax=Uliginosibacterium aquaticum TaxID=2731212 RepID=A0ABX2IC26_9RHOO|nr:MULTISPECIES: glutamyl-tRNA reductase [Uliginosibacterium]MDO6386289.1 glutamyl-tRNA reductase [Uliginosibacterium sp. 31-12]NSL53512.1 glutamyl-tRNA reductase [Uliginosibacterium aquaticum]PLK49507.1 glutamyl-tRNA reductase [Uliginosibacterium sp. TH139]
MPLFALGLNHHTAPVAIRERVAFPPESLIEALQGLLAEGVAQEAALLSTCNRTELYCSTDNPEAAADWLARRRDVALRDIAPFLYTLPEQEAVQHVFRVASGLDSMVLGEPQILGQLKEAARLADSAGTLGANLHKLFQNSFAVAKEVRSSTAIGANTVSMAAAAVHLAARIFERMSDTRILFVGAGEMIELCAAHFAGSQPRSMSIANRTLSRAETLASRFGAEVLPLEALADALPRHDVIISCTGSPLPLIGRGMAERALKIRRRRPLVMVDLAVPRDIEPEVATLSDIFLYTVDDLAQIVSKGMESRQSAVAEAETIIRSRVDGFQHWLGSRDAVPTIRQLREHADNLRQAELQRAQRQLARGEDPQAVLEAFSHALSNKLLHAPTHFLNHAEGERIAPAVSSVREVFQLDQSGAHPPRQDS